jgi:RNA polymerase sigma-70 factor, ECF subfamily
MQKSIVFKRPSGPVRTDSRELTESEAIHLAQNGDASGFAYLYGLHGRHVFAVCLRMVGDVALAEDLTQEAFMRMFRKIGTFRGDSALSTWLHRLAVNVVLMHLRHKKTKPEHFLDEADSSNQGSDAPIEHGYADPSLTRAADRLDLARAIRELPPGCKQIFLLHDVIGYEHHEIANRLSCSVGNSKSQLHKARLRLRSILLGGIGRRTSGQLPANAVALHA